MAKNKTMTDDEKKAYGEMMEQKKDDFLKNRAEIAETLPLKSEFYKAYLDKLPFLKESCLNALCIVKADLKGFRFQTKRDWMSEMQEVKKGEEPLELLSSETFTGRDGKSHPGYRLINVYDNTQLERPIEIGFKTWTLDEFASALEESAQHYCTVKTGSIEKTYQLDYPAEDKPVITMSDQLDMKSLIGLLLLASAVNEAFLEKIDRHRIKKDLKNASETAYDASYMLCVKFLGPDALDGFPVSAERMKGMDVKQINKELKAIRDTYSFLVGSLEYNLNKEIIEK